MLIISNSIAAPTTRPAENQKLVHVEMPLDEKGSFSLAKTVRFEYAWGEGQITGFFSRGSSRLNVNFDRGVEFFLLTSNESQPIAHEMYASNEDRVIIYDLRKKSASKITLAHDESEDYIHLHFVDFSSKGAELQCVEEEYAGTNPARRRKISVDLSGERPVIKKSAWEKEK